MLISAAVGTLKSNAKTMNDPSPIGICGSGPYPRIAHSTQAMPSDARAARRSRVTDPDFKTPRTTASPIADTMISVARSAIAAPTAPLPIRLCISGMRTRFSSRFTTTAAAITLAQVPGRPLAVTS